MGTPKWTYSNPSSGLLHTTQSKPAFSSVFLSKWVETDPFSSSGFWAILDPFFLSDHTSHPLANPVALASKHTQILTLCHELHCYSADPSHRIPCHIYCTNIYLVSLLLLKWGPDHATFLPQSPQWLPKSVCKSQQYPSWSSIPYLSDHAFYPCLAHSTPATPASLLKLLLHTRKIPVLSLCLWSPLPGILLSRHPCGSLPHVFTPNSALQ